MVGGAERSSMEHSLIGRREQWKRLFRRYLLVDLGLIVFCALCAYGAGRMALPFVASTSLPGFLAACSTVGLSIAWALKLHRDYPR